MGFTDLFLACKWGCFAGISFSGEKDLKFGSKSFCSGESQQFFFWVFTHFCFDDSSFFLVCNGVFSEQCIWFLDKNLGIGDGNWKI